jgi:hypothetical protein
MGWHIELIKQTGALRRPILFKHPSALAYARSAVDIRQISAIQLRHIVSCPVRIAL